MCVSLVPHFSVCDLKYERSAASLVFLFLFITKYKVIMDNTYLTLRRQVEEKKTQTKPKPTYTHMLKMIISFVLINVSRKVSIFLGCLFECVFYYK